MSARFAKALEAAAEIKAELAQYNRPGSRKLTAEAFFKLAKKIAHTDDGRLNLLEQSLIRTEDAPAVGPFIEAVVRELKKPNWPMFPVKPHMLLHAYGNDSVEPQAATLGFTIGEVTALAARVATQKYPDSFGPVEDMGVLYAREEELKDALPEALATLAKSWCYDDFIIDMERNLSRLSFKVSGGAVALTEGWPERLVDWTNTQVVAQAA